MQQKKAFEDQYKAFEDQFRGSRDLIRGRLSIYIPLLSQIDGARPNARKVIDLGSGRGEWLQLLTEHGWEALGVDPNAGMAEVAREKGIETKDDDALNFLKSQDDNSFGLVTAFHVVEHLENDYLLKLLKEIDRVLIPGGITILETPNPENLTVASWSFYMDPTHTRPIPPALLRFLVQQSGLQDAYIFRLNGLEAGSNAGPLETNFHALFNGAFDYSIIAQKASDDHSVENLEKFVYAHSQAHPSRFEFLAENARKIDLKIGNVDEHSKSIDGALVRINDIEIKGNDLDQKVEKLIGSFDRLENNVGEFRNEFANLSMDVNRLKNMKLSAILRELLRYFYRKMKFILGFSWLIQRRG